MRFASVFAPLCLTLCLTALLALPRAAGADVLWDQLGNSGYAFCSHDFEEAYDCYDCVTADDFTVPEPGWIIEQIEWDALLYYGESVPVQMVHFYVFPDRGDNLGDFDNPVWVEDGMIDGTVYSGTNLYTLATPAFLPAGHYFLGIQAKFDFASYSKHYWVMTTYAPVGQEAHMINPAGCFGSGTDWFQPAEGYDASFRLYGLVAGAPEAVIDLPLGDAVIQPGQHVLFAGTATDEDGEIVDWLWTFGEGSGIEDMHVEDPGYVQFNNLGVFEVIFNAQDNDGNWDPMPDRRTITVEAIAPDAVIDLPVGDVMISEGDYVEFAGTATDENGEIVDWLWTFGEGSGIDDMHVEDPGLVQFNNVGVFTVTFNAQDDDGYWDPTPDERTITVNPGDVLWDQLSASEYGFASQDFEEAYECYDCLSADDFTVPEPGWIIETVEWDMLLYYGAEAPVHGIHIYIMPDRGDNLGDYENPVYHEFAPVDTVYDGTNTVTLAAPLALEPGHYFFGAAPALDFEPYSQCFLQATTYAPVGQEFHMINPNGCFGSGSDWFQPATGYDASFRLYGRTYGVGIPDAVIDLPLGNAVVEAGDHVLFAGTATDEDGEIVDWLWTFGEGSGIDDMHVEDPGYVQFNNPGVFEVTFNAQDNDGYWDTTPDHRTVTVYDPCIPTNAPDPEPYCDGALFGEPASGYPGWVWFSIPLDPSDCCDEENCYDPETLLGFGCSGKLWYWDRYGKTAQVYQPPFLEWDLAVGDGYLLYLESAVENPWYSGEIPDVDYEVKLGRLGWTWVGMPGLQELWHLDFMDAVLVKYPSDETGYVRTAGEDYNETPYGNNWLVWGWAFWDTYSQAPRTFTPYSPFGNNTCYPWIGYRLWVNVGTAQSADDPDQVTLIWPRPGG